MKLNHSVLLFFLLFSGCASNEIAGTSQPIVHDGQNTSNSKEDILLDKKFFKIHYNPKYRIANFVEYKLTAENLKKSFVKRKNKFYPDPELAQMNIVPVNDKDYAHTGYDRGHLAPSGDFEWSVEANESTFTMANMTPQRPKLNRVSWAKLEKIVRSWACTEKELKVITGPILDETLESLDIGVIIPKRFFKVILDITPPRKSIGFILSQDSENSNDYKSSVKTVRDIESITGVHFFDEVEQPERDKIESEANLADWVGFDCKSKRLNQTSDTDE